MKTSHLSDHLDYLKLEYIQREHRALAETASREGWAHGDYLDRLVEGEVLERGRRALERRLRLARFPYRKTLEQYQWTWPKKINQAEIRQLFRLEFLQSHTNVVFVGPVGLGKTHLAVALGQAACEAGHEVLFVPAVTMINDLVAAQTQQRLKQQLRKYAGVGGADLGRGGVSADRQGGSGPDVPGVGGALREGVNDPDDEPCVQELA